MSYTINKEIENQIYDALDKMIEEFLKGSTFGTRHAREVLTKDDFENYFDETGMTLKDAKKEFKKKKNIIGLIKDTKYPGYQLFKKQLKDLDEKEIDEKYQDLIKKILNKIIQDRMAKDNDKKTVKENSVLNFGEFLNEKLDLITEMKLPILKLDELLDEVTSVSGKSLKKLLVTYYKTYIEYIDLIDKKKHTFRINDMTGDILNNNRVSFDSMVFDKSDLMTIKNNIIDYAIGEFYINLPNEVDVFGIIMNPSTFINKEELKESFNGQITDQVTVNIIAEMTNFKFQREIDGFYIWSNKQTPVQPQVQTQVQPQVQVNGQPLQTQVQ